VPRIALRPLVLLAGVLHFGAGLFMAVTPRAFYDSVGTYPPFNGHYLRDLATFYLALGIGLIVAAGKRSWQVPLLTLTVVQYALHVGNHVLDVGDAEPGWKGPVNAAWLAIVGLVLYFVLRTASRERDAAAPQSGRARM
jgi:hypothetical protein